MRIAVLSLALLSSVASVAGLAAPAAAADRSWADAGYGPACDDWSVLARVTEKFAYQDRHVANEGMAISGINDIREQAPKVGGPGFVHRRYCSATAWLSNGRKSQVAYLIEGPGLATFSIGWHVESCLIGHDPWRIYDSQCRAIRP
jgi:hypothetical protein